MKNKNKFVLVSVFVLTLLIVAVPLASRAMVIKKGDNVFIDEDVNGNLFTAGNMVIIDGVVNGDVFVAGNNITIKGVVNGDVFAAGNSINIEGRINGSLRMVGSNVGVKGQIWRNITGVANNLGLDEGAVVGQHITYAGANLVIDASVGGQVDAMVGELVLRENAVLVGNIDYKSKKEADIREGAQVRGEVSFSLWETPDKVAKTHAFKRFTGFFKMIGFFSILAVALLLTYLLPKLTDKVYGRMREKFWSHFGVGLVAVIVIPVVCLLLLVTVLGIPLALLSLAMFFVGMFFAKAIAVTSIGKFISEKLEWKIPKILVILLAGLVFFGVSLIPVFGWLACFFVVLSAVGGLIKAQVELAKDWR